jgi:hypothetical protein
MIVNGMREAKPRPFSKIFEFIQGRETTFKWWPDEEISEKTVDLVVFQ